MCDVFVNLGLRRCIDLEYYVSVYILIIVDFISFTLLQCIFLRKAAFPEIHPSISPRLIYYLIYIKNALQCSLVTSATFLDKAVYVLMVEA